MKVALYTCIVSPHQLPLARAIMRLHPEVTFHYVYTQELPADATKRGWEWHEEYDWLVSAEKQPERARQILENADVVLSGERDVDLFERRSEAGKKTLYMFERWFKPIPLSTSALNLNLSIPGWVRMFVPWYWRMARRIVRLANRDPNFRCLAIGPWAVKDMRLVGVRADKIRPWAYFVEPTSLPAKSSPPPKPSRLIRVLWLGRMLRLKRIDTIIKAVKRLNAKGLEPVILLTLLGQGDEELRLRGLSAGANNILFQPGVPIDRVRQVMREHDVLVFSSNGEDGWGAVVNEALEESLIVLGTKETGASETMLPEGCKFHAGDDRALANLLEKVAKGEIVPCGIGDWSVSRGVEKLMTYCYE